MKSVDRFSLGATRLVGVEVELDSSYSAPIHQLTVPGWKQHADGSIQRGFEYVMDPPVPYNAAHRAVSAFSEAARLAKVYAGRAGSVHVHVQAHDLTPHNLFVLSQLYVSCLDFIKFLVPPSRGGHGGLPNFYCKSHLFANFDEFQAYWELNSRFDTREDARNRFTPVSNSWTASKRYNVVNMLTTRLVDPAKRSVEFRQGGASTRYASLFGWITFCVAMVELCKVVQLNERSPATWDEFKALLERVDPALAKWVEWRRWYLYREPTDEDVAGLVDAMADGREYGLFTLGRRTGFSLNVVRLALRRLMDMGSIESTQRTVTVREQPMATTKYALRTLPDKVVTERYYAIINESRS